MAVPQTSNANDITTVIASLASRQSNRPKAQPLSGPKRAAILMLALGEQYGGKVWSLLDDDEVRELSIHMSTLGTVEAETVEDLLLEFVSRMSASGALMASMMITSGTVTNRIDQLEKAGLVSREPNPDDGRSMIVALKSAGVTALKIEGRQRGKGYVTEVVRAFRRAVDAAESGGDPVEIDGILAGLSEGGRQTTGAYRKTWR